MRRILTSEELLQQWAPFTLFERCQIILKLWQIKISPTHLRRFYLENKVRYRQGKHVYKYAIQRRETLGSQRRVCAEVLGNLIAK